VAQQRASEKSATLQIKLVPQLDRSAEQDIFWFHVAMHVMILMKMGQSRQNLSHQGLNIGGGQGRESFETTSVQ
jgi:hypothetical protein